MKFAWRLKIYKGLCRGGTGDCLQTLPWEQVIRQCQVKSVCLQLLHEAAYHFSICIEQGERQCTPLNIRHTQPAFYPPASYFTLGCFAWDERGKLFVHSKSSSIFFSKYSPMLCCKRCLTQSKSIFKPELREQNYDGLDILMTNGFTYQTIPSLKYFHSIIQCNDFHQYHQTRTLIYERDPTFRAESTDHRDRSWHRV